MRIYKEKNVLRYPENLGKTGYGPLRIKILTRKLPVRIDKQPVPLNDYIHFKTMSGNEILLNLDNCENLRNGELVSGLFELG